MKHQQEEHHALSGFFAKEYNKLTAFVQNNYTGNAILDAEDIVQDVALNLFTKVDFNKPIENMAAYIYRALKNKIIDIQRKKKLQVFSLNREEETNEDPFVKQTADPGDDTPNISNDEAMQLKMMYALEQLAPEQKEIIIVTEFEGYTFNEISNK